MSPDDDHTSPTYEDRKTRAVQVFTGGSMSLGVGVYLYLHKTRSIRSTTAATLGLGLSALLAGAMMYASDEDVYSGAGLQRERYRNTAAAGLISGGAGIALSGVGLWLLSRERRDAFVPIVQVAHERGFIGWSGRY